MTSEFTKACIGVLAITTLFSLGRCAIAGNKEPVVVTDKESLTQYVNEGAKNLCTYLDTGLANPEIWVRSRIKEADEFLVNSDKYRDGQHNFALRTIGAIGHKAAIETCPKYRTPVGRALIEAIDCKKGVCHVIEPARR